MLTDATYRDFELTLEVKPDWGVCSGLFLRSTEKGQCYQVMIDYLEQGNIGELYREGLDGRTNRTYQLQGIYRDAEKKILQHTSAKPVRKNELDLGGTLQFPVAGLVKNLEKPRLEYHPSQHQGKPTKNYHSPK